MIDSLPPAAILILGAFLVPLLRGRVQQIYLVALPILSLLHLLTLWNEPHGAYLSLTLFDHMLTPVRIDGLSLIFALIFHVVLLLSVIYSLHVRDTTQHVAGMVYAGAAIAAVFAGDLITLFVFWELTAISSVFLIWASRNERSFRAGMRYLIIHVSSGVLLLAGAVFHFRATGSLAFDHLGPGTIGTNLILIAFGIKCAFPFLHNWLQDAYPEATITGTVFLSSFTTKLAIYALARGFQGMEALIWVGVVMTIFPIFYAVIENNLRRVLAYSLNNQLGFMVVGIGVGTPMAMNGVVAHAFVHLLYKSLLFMSMGAVLYRTGTVQASRLGGLYKSMPWTTTFCLVGAASISAFPLFSGFVAKSLTLTAVADKHVMLASLLLLFASTGVLEHSGIKIPYFAFFGHDSGIRCKEAPWNMLLAMGVTAFLCIFIGVNATPLYNILPYAHDYGVFNPYTTSHVVGQLQLLFFAILAFWTLQRTGLYPREIPSVILDTDVIYRKLAPAMVRGVARMVTSARTVATSAFEAQLSKVLVGIERHYGPAGVLARSWATSTSMLWVLLLLLTCLVLYYR